jgi:hypothetical protein
LLAAGTVSEKLVTVGAGGGPMLIVAVAVFDVTPQGPSTLYCCVTVAA